MLTKMVCIMQIAILSRFLGRDHTVKYLANSSKMIRTNNKLQLALRQQSKLSYILKFNISAVHLILNAYINEKNR